MDSEIERRKRDHVMNSLRPDSQYDLTSWLEFVIPIHNALPEIDYDRIDTSVVFFGKHFSYPIYISGMTGGFNDAYKINSELANIAEKYNIPLGLGSIRAMLKNPNLKYTYDVKRGKDIFMIANIGGVQLKEYSNRTILDSMDSIEADAIAIHLNPAQELIQKEGDLNWDGVMDRIVELADDTRVIVKEVGAGLSYYVIDRLRDSKVAYYDVAGAGGTSWTKIEYLRNPDAPKGFENWGIPTALALLMNSNRAKLLASGGIRNGVDGFKTILLGAELFGMAKPFLEMAMGKSSNILDLIIQQFKGAMFLTGSKDINSIRKVDYVILDPLKSSYEQIRSSIPKR
ncbi:MAG: type 2 isopentenyl-diphosphate Delta-isomerase [Candidatus Anstonellales archaeon]